MDFTHLNGRIALGIAIARDYIDWAEDALIAGASSPNLEILASLGLDREPDSAEVRRYFQHALDDLDLVLPPRDRALMDYARQLCRRMLEGGMEPGAGLARLDGLFPASGYAPIFSIWDELSDDLAFLREEGRSYFNSGLGPHNRERFILDVARQFLLLTDKALPAGFFGLAACGECGHIGLPSSVREVDPSFSSRPRPRLHGNRIEVPVCARCGARHPLGMGDYLGRQRYLDSLGSNVDA